MDRIKKLFIPQLVLTSTTLNSREFGQHEHHRSVKHTNKDISFSCFLSLLMLVPMHTKSCLGIQLISFGSLQIDIQNPVKNSIETWWLVKKVFK